MKGWSVNQPNFEDSKLMRRASDFNPSAQCACGQEVMEVLKKIDSDIRDIKHGMGTIRTAFVRNDLGDPDYEGHRQAHLSAIRKDKEIDQLKMAGAVKFVGAVMGVVGLIFATGLGAQIQKWVGH